MNKFVSLVACVLVAMAQVTEQAQVEESGLIVPLAASLCSKGCTTVCGTLDLFCRLIPFAQDLCSNVQSTCNKACSITCNCIKGCGPHCDAFEANCMTPRIGVTEDTGRRRRPSRLPPRNRGRDGDYQILFELPKPDVLGAQTVRPPMPNEVWYGATGRLSKPDVLGAQTVRPPMPNEVWYGATGRMSKPDVLGTRQGTGRRRRRPSRRPSRNRDRDGDQKTWFGLPKLDGLGKSVFCPVAGMSCDVSCVMGCPQAEFANVIMTVLSETTADLQDFIMMSLGLIPRKKKSEASIFF